MERTIQRYQIQVESAGSEHKLLAESYEGRIWTCIEQVGASKYVVRASIVYLDGTWRDVVKEQCSTYEQAAIRYSQLFAK